MDRLWEMGSRLRHQAETVSRAIDYVGVEAKPWWMDRFTKTRINRRAEIILVISTILESIATPPVPIPLYRTTFPEFDHLLSSNLLPSIRSHLASAIDFAGPV